MNKIFGLMLSAALLCGTTGTAFATTTDGNCDTKLHQQVQALQKQVAALQATIDIQSSLPDGSPIPSGG